MAFEYYDTVRCKKSGREGYIVDMCQGVMVVEYPNGDREEFDERTDQLELIG